MSIQGEPISHEEIVEIYLKDISQQLRLMNARIEDAFNTDIKLEDIQTLEDSDNGD
jgi:hypothetical protein